MLDYPRIINPTTTFNSLVDWFYHQISFEKVPGFLIGISGTDSLVAFLAAAKAFEKIGKPERVLGVHFSPSEDFLYDHPEAEVHLWFEKEIIPWLRKQTKSPISVINSQIDWRCDGQRWGYLMDLSVVSDDTKRTMRLPEDQYWVVGTRNLTEDMLLNFSNVSMSVSLQPLIHFWKSEILQISKYLNIPQLAIDKSCETDCICGRLLLPSQHIQEVDWLLMKRRDELSQKYIDLKISIQLQAQLTAFICAQIAKNNFKQYIPYMPSSSITNLTNDPLVISFKEGSLNLKEFDHYQHVYVAWCFLRDYSFEDAVGSYSYFLKNLLESNGQLFRFNVETTKSYFNLIEDAIKLNPTDSFEDLIRKVPSLLTKKI